MFLASAFTFQNEANKIGYELTREVTIHSTAVGSYIVLRRFLRRRTRPEEFQVIKGRV